MASKSVSSASKAASSAMSSGSSQAASAASQASASLASGSAKASSYADKAADNMPAKSTSIFALSPLTLTILAVVIGAAYYNGYLDGLIAYIQQMLNQAQDQKEQIKRSNIGGASGHTTLREKDNLNQGTVKTEAAADRLHMEAQTQEIGRGQGAQTGGSTIQADGPSSNLLSSQALET